LHNVFHCHCENIKKNICYHILQNKNYTCKDDKYNIIFCICKKVHLKLNCRLKKVKRYESITENI